MDEDKKQKLAQIRKKMDLANKFRLFFLFIALVILLLVFWGNKLFEGQAWFELFTQKSYSIAAWDLLFMLICTFVKFFFVVRYNREVKKL